MQEEMLVFLRDFLLLIFGMQLYLYDFIDLILKNVSELSELDLTIYQIPFH